MARSSGSTTHPARPKRRPQRGRRPHGRAARASAPRPPRLDLVDSAVLEVHGLVHDQGWLADRALERALRRERKMWASERRLAAESLYGLLRMQGQLDWLLAGVEPGAPASGVALQARYAAWLVRFAGVAADEAAARLAVPRSALRSLAGADQRIAAVSD